jgi:hypothetical protein
MSDRQDDRVYVQWSGKWWRVHADEAFSAVRALLDELKRVDPERVRLLALEYGETTITSVDERTILLARLGGDLVEGQLAAERRASQPVDATPTRLASAQARHSTHGARR